MNTADRFYTIDDDVFNRFQGYRRGVVVAKDVINCESPDKLISLLRAEEDSIRQQLDPESLLEHPRIFSWREAYRAFGAKPGKFRPSMEAMVRRVLRNQQIPAINALVDIGNIVSLRHIVPAGGHAIDVISGDLSLRAASGDESFTPFGADKVEHPEPGEIIFAEGDVVLTRRWTWRQANHTLTLPTTTAIEYNVDGLPPVELSEIEAASRDIMELVAEFCGGSSRYEVLTQENPRIQLI